MILGPKNMDVNDYLCDGCDLDITKIDEILVIVMNKVKES